MTSLSPSQGHLQSRRPIVVTGATGKTGRVVVDELLRAGAPVRAIVRRADERSAVLAQAGAEIAVADLHDYVALVPALRGASAAYFIPPWDRQSVDSAAAFAAAARDTSLPAIVELSQWLSNPSHPSLYTRQHWLITRMFSELRDVMHVTINPGFFADNLLILDLLRNAAHLGLYPYAAPREMRNAPPSNEDIGRVAAAVLMDPLAHAGRSYRPTGPALIGGDDVVATLSKLLERRITPFSPPRLVLAKALAAAGYREPQVADTLEYFRETSAWTVDAPNDVVKRLTGREPEDFETIARRYLSHPSLRPTLANRMATIRDFVRMLATQVRLPDAYRRANRIAQPASARLSSDSSLWFEAHTPHHRALVTEALEEVSS